MPLAGINKVFVKRGTDFLLSEKGRYDCHRNGMGNEIVNYTLYFKVLGGVVEEMSSSTDEVESIENCQTIGEQLLFKSKPDYIVKCEGIDNVRDLYRVWTIYKLKDFDLADWLKSQLQLAADQLKAEIDAVCSN